MKTITKNVYSFTELIELEKEKKVSSSVVEKVRSKLSDFNSDDSWYEYTLEKWTSILNQIGFKDPKIQFSGFSSQGDGASFEASLDSEKLIWFQTHVIKSLDCIKPTKRTGTEEDFLPYVVHKLDGSYGYDKDFAKLKRLQEVIYGKVIRGTSRYSHENTCSVELDRCDFPERMDGVLDDWQRSIQDLRYRLCKAIYKDLETEHEYLISDEALIELDNENDYQWDIHGNKE